MGTQAQNEANRRNAAGSTGPRTSAGKAKSRMNAIKSGLSSFGGPVLLLPGESREELDAFRDMFLADLKPVGAREEQLANEIIAYSWRLDRAAKIERGILILGILDDEERGLLGFKRALEAAKGDAPGAKVAEFLQEREAIVEDGNEGPPEFVKELFVAIHEARESDEARLANSFIKDAAGPNALEKNNRYENGNFRRRNQALKEFHALQAARSEDTE
jgi:hypothetical protein